MTTPLSTDGACFGRVAVVTGAGRGLGAEYARRLARAGAAVVVNDLGVGLDGEADGTTPADEVVAEIRAAGGQAVASGHDVSSWKEAEQLVELAVDTFGDLDILVNNAGVLRDRTITRMTEAEWDSVIRVHLKGTFATTHHAANHWRERHAKHPERVGRLINTTSVSGLFGNVGQANYSAAKAGIAAMTIVASLELGRYGVTANCVSPGAATRMTATLGGDPDDPTRSPGFPAAVVEWLASRHSDGVTGRVFLTSGKRLSVAEGWEHGTPARPSEDLTELDATLRDLLATARPNADMRG
ncbi:NAD(P)-dependent dehydrogenase, short-chain alcohol dehydrogenase family [Thermomonospora echinospora]|uniref:NAD(P)-dependent dehydrogenase, short-chain alcohol dehydrogenase family n=1 Tax=Thermomonospora echinospora TaxID=1992 RepID=A0A1H6DNA4_9ACTN|nr:SDR family NAD(P)-dependent oxidoreductase [Thermomonospora echinospora]SEG86233.1 NAD(P)-dependent dehydrogenase, short-chain alcohol dehydrogenase family [Thermomonospora echinospora]